MADQIFYSYKFYFYQNVFIYIRILLTLNLKRPTKLYEDVKVIICKVMCDLVEQRVVSWLAVIVMHNILVPYSYIKIDHDDGIHF